MSYESIYHSPWHNPGIFVLANVLLLVYLIQRKVDTPEAHGLRRLLRFFAVLAIADALLTGELTPIPASIVIYPSIPFVILGDVRFFYLVERYARAHGRTMPQSGLFLRSLGWGLIVPATAYFTKITVLPERPLPWLFLLYETYFLVIALVFRRILLPKWLTEEAIPAERASWILGITRFELLFYALWATSDVVILSGHAIGYLPRMVPNILYYAGFGFFVALTAPKELRP